MEGSWIGAPGAHCFVVQPVIDIRETVSCVFQRSNGDMVL